MEANGGRVGFGEPGLVDDLPSAFIVGAGLAVSAEAREMGEGSSTDPLDPVLSCFEPECEFTEKDCSKGFGSRSRIVWRGGRRGTAGPAGAGAGCWLDCDAVGARASLLTLGGEREGRLSIVVIVGEKLAGVGRPLHHL